MNNLVELINISKSYEGKKNIKVLSNINYNFKKGKIYSLMGPSGSGKSTLLNLISLIDFPSSGSIKLNNLKINYNNNSINDEIRANNIGIIYQEKNLLSDFTALENVYLARISFGIDQRKSINQSINILKKVGLNKRLNHYPSDLSGGESQRVAISRAIINTPRIILADEPTGSLDTKTANEIFSLYLNLKSKKRAIIYATHKRDLSNRADYKLNILDGTITKKK